MTGKHGQTPNILHDIHKTNANNDCDIDISYSSLYNIYHISVIWDVRLSPMSRITIDSFS